MLKKIYQKILNILFPIYCIGCRKIDTPLCIDCISNFPVGVNTEDVSNISLFDYKNKIVKKSIWTLKYVGNKEIGKIFACSIYDRLLEEISEQNIFSHFNNPLIIPIPLSKNRLKERGFNQSELLAKEICLLDNGVSFILIKNVLYKIKDTRSQVSIKDRRERLRNLRGCFSVKNQEIIRNKNIILVDDVTTTGATIAEAKKTLIAAGAKRIIAFTIAH